MESELRVRKIRSGTVIDHIPRGRALVVTRILGITGEEEDTVLIAINVPSVKLGRKDIVKVENRYLREEEVNKIALVAPTATINIIKEYKVDKKWRVKIPKVLKGIIKCPNYRCITNRKGEKVESKFLLKGEKPLKLVCAYCDAIVREEEVLELVI